MNNSITPLLCTSIFLALLCSGCGNNQSTATQASNNTTPSSTINGDGPVGQPTDYFPTHPGDQWDYRITLASSAQEPLNEKVTDWPTGGNHQISSEERGRFLAAMTSKGKEFDLSFKVKGPATDPCPYKWKDSVELTVLKDELGVFYQADHVYWVIGDPSGYQALLVCTYPPTSEGAPDGGEWGTWGSSDGNSSRFFFFGDKPGVELSLGEKSNDGLEFLGLENDTLHFVRRVKQVTSSTSTPSDDALDTSFTEDMYFKQGVGLNKLIQKVHGQTTMTWDLISFTPQSG